MIELALTLPVMILLLIGLMEFGSGLNSYLTVLAAGRDAARMGAQGGIATEATLLSMIDNETARLPSELPTSSENCGDGAGVCIEGLPAASPGTCATDSTTCVSGRKAVYVRVCYDHPTFIGIPGLLDGPIRMCSQTTMRIAL
jgi:hypothetical protein